MSLQSNAVATIYSAAGFVWLLFEGGVYFFGKSGDINDSWIRYKVRTSETVMVARCYPSTCSLSVLLSAVGTTHTTQTVLALAWLPSSKTIRTHGHMPRLLAAATIRVQRLFKEIRYT